MTIDREEAERLWVELAAAVQHQSELTAKILETKAWVPLGYATFTEAWRVRLGGLIDKRSSGVVWDVCAQIVQEGYDPREEMDGYRPATFMKLIERGVPFEVVADHTGGVGLGGACPVHQHEWCQRAHADAEDVRQRETLDLSGRVYFIKGEATGLIKIGRTTGDVINRLRDLQTGSPDLLRLVAVIHAPNAAGLENMMHTFYEDARSHGEWFRPTPALMAHINSLNEQEVAA